MMRNAIRPTAFVIRNLPFFTRNIPLFSKCINDKQRPSFSTEAHVTKANSPNLQLNTEIAINTAALSAFEARAGICFKEKNLLKDACSHISHSSSSATSRLNLTGRKILDGYTSLFVLQKYPDLPAPVVETIVEAFISDAALASVGKSLGIQFVMQYKKRPEVASKENFIKEEAGPPSVRAWGVLSLVGAVYYDKGPIECRSFINNHILSRNVDIKSHLDFHLKMNRPHQMLSYLMKSTGKQAPVSRLLKETGRNSHSPVFIVGVYSGIEKIGESFGSSLKMAENRAVRDALIKHYSKEVQQIDIPLDFPLLEEDFTFFNK